MNLFRSNYYAGIGSRETPEIILTTMRNVAHLLELRGYTLRSGGANGADKAFGLVVAKKEIYVPWPHFNGVTRWTNFNHDWAERVACQFHPAWDTLPIGGRRLMTRNTCQVLGPGPDGPVSDFVVCWTKDGKASGGTGQALRIAKAYDIEVFNLHDPKRTGDLIRMLERLK